MSGCRKFLAEAARLEAEKAAQALQAKTGAAPAAAAAPAEAPAPAESVSQPSGAWAPGPGSALTFRGVKYLFRDAPGNLTEFTPGGQEDLSSWTDMLSIAEYSNVTEGEGLAATANTLLGLYTGSGAMLLKTNSVPATSERPAEHFISVMFGRPAFLEAVFARLKLIDGVGYAMIYSHRIYGNRVGDQMSAWLEENGPLIEQELMAWEGMSELAVSPVPAEGGRAAGLVTLPAQGGMFSRLPIWVFAAAGIVFLAAAGLLLRRLRRGAPAAPQPEESGRMTM